MKTVVQAAWEEAHALAVPASRSRARASLAPVWNQEGDDREPHWLPLRE